MRGRGAKSHQESARERGQRRRCYGRQIRVAGERSGEDRNRHAECREDHHRRAAAVGPLERSESDRHRTDCAECADRRLREHQTGYEGDGDANRAAERGSTFELRPVDSDGRSENLAQESQGIGFYRVLQGSARFYQVRSNAFRSGENPEEPGRT